MDVRGCAIVQYKGCTTVQVGFNNRARLEQGQTMILLAPMGVPKEK